MYIIKLLKLSLIHIFYHLWPAVIAKKSVEFLSKQNLIAFKLSLLMCEEKLCFKA